MIVSSDTLYSPGLTQPLLRTIRALSVLSTHTHTHTHATASADTAIGAPARAPPVYLCIERRDPVLIDRALAEAREAFGFLVERVPHRKLARALDKAGAAWDKEDWDGIEIWKLRLDAKSIQSAVGT